MNDNIRYAPWTDEEVEVLNRFQKNNHFHPFTCGGDRNDSAHKEHAEANDLSDTGILVAETNGWHCPVCGYCQNWAHEGMFHIV